MNRKDYARIAKDIAVEVANNSTIIKPAQSKRKDEIDVIGEVVKFGIRWWLRRRK